MVRKAQKYKDTGYKSREEIIAEKNRLKEIVMKHQETMLSIYAKLDEIVDDLEEEVLLTGTSDFEDADAAVDYLNSLIKNK